MNGLPVNLRIAGRRALVVGAGLVATRRINQFLAAGAEVSVVAPEASGEVARLAAAGSVKWHRRGFSPEDLSGAWLVATATGLRDVDSSVTELAEAQQIWCMNSADATYSSALPMTSVDGDDGIAIAVSGGSDPGRARALRDAIGLLLRSGQLPTAATRTGQPRDSSVGSVALVGAGPGDPALLTIAAMRAVADADVLVVDRLAPAVLWQSPAPGVEVIDVGKLPGKHAVPQEEINTILVTKARAGHRVARIKGGDPFVLGRGGEEALACLAADVPVEVIPGITSAVSVPAAAGIPVTQRGVTASFVVASAHDGPDGVLRAAGDGPTNATLVLLMGVGRLPEIANGLIEAGREASTPVAIIESGWTVDQRTTVTTLGAVSAGQVAASPPAVVVIGEVVTLREALGDLGRSSQGARHA